MALRPVSPGVRSSDTVDCPQGGRFNSCEGRQDRQHANYSGQAIREFLHRRERIGLESDVQAALVVHRSDYKVPRNCGAEDWHSSQDAAVSVSIMKSPLHAIVMCLSIFTLVGAADVGEAGPFENFFRSVRNSFARPTSKPRSAQPRRSSRQQSNETPPSDASDASNNQILPSPTPVTAPPNLKNVRVAKATATRKKPKGDLPYGIPVPGRQGLVTSPFSPDSGYIDVRSFPPGTEVKDPYTGKTFLTP